MHTAWMESTGETWRLGRRPALDGLRGIAILLVVGCHVDAGSILLPHAGAVGVTLFFVLSGYLITGIVTRQHHAGGIDFRRFYARRARRLLPALVAMLAITSVVVLSIGGPRSENYLGRSLIALGYAANYFRMAGGDMGVLGFSWSLGVEEQFYLVAPLILGLVLTRRGVATAAQMAAWLTAIAVSWRLFAAFAFDYDHVYYPLGTNAFALLAGAWLALHELTGRRISTTRATGPAGLALVLALALFPGGSPETIEAVTEYGAPLVALAGVAAIAGAEDLRVLRSQALVWFGAVSYSWYLWHQCVIYLADSQGRWVFPTLPARVIAAGIALLIAWASYRFVEQPILNGLVVSRRSPIRGEAIGGDVVKVGDLASAVAGKMAHADAPARQA